MHKSCWLHGNTINAGLEAQSVGRGGASPSLHSVSRQQGRVACFGQRSLRFAIPANGYASSYPTTPPRQQKLWRKIRKMLQRSQLQKGRPARHSTYSTAMAGLWLGLVCRSYMFAHRQRDPYCIHRWSRKQILRFAAVCALVHAKCPKRKDTSSSPHAGPSTKLCLKRKD